ncbi:phospholipase C [Sorangium sp. So ce1024]|uniref:phospholipase C n=2 Tax=unclassified Sorangium TaxID=2621164 RepID=UPI003EFDBEFB
MTREMIVINAYDVNLPPIGIAREAAPTPRRTSVLRDSPSIGGVTVDPGGSGTSVVRAPTSIGGVTGGGRTKATDITVELLLGEQALGTHANHLFVQVPGTSEQYFLRVTRRAESSGSRRYSLEVNYPSILPILERRIPLAFFQQGFDENWNNHPYVTSFRVHGDRATVNFDADFAALYGLPNPLEINWNLWIIDFNDVNSRSIRFSAGADRNPYDFQSGESPYFSCTVECESDGPDEIDVTTHPDLNLRTISFEFRFYLVVVGTELQYVVKVISPTLNSIRDRIPGVDVRATIVSKLEATLNDLQRGTSGSQFGRFLTPWLLGEHHEVFRLAYDRPSNNIVVSYVGPRAKPSNEPVVVDGSHMAPSPLPPALAGAPVLFDVPAEMPQTAEPGGWPRDPMGPRYVTTAGTMPDKFDHVVVLMMENRSFDQVLGYLSRDLGRTDVNGLAPDGSPAAQDQYNEYNGRVYRPQHITDTRWISMSTPGPAHEHDSVVSQMSDGMRHFVSNYAKRVGDDPGKLRRIMDYYGAAELPTYAQLVNQFAICDHWFCSHVGPTWPNRFIAFTGLLNRDGEGEPEVDQPHFGTMTPIEAPTLFDHLSERGISWRVYEHGYSFLRLYTRYTFDLDKVVSFNHPTKGFLATAARGELPAVTWIEPDYIDLPPGNDDHPPADMAQGQILVAKIVKALVESPQWERTMLIITYDEHGGFYDHVTPPKAAPLLPPSQLCQLGPRVPAFVVSPYVTPGKVVNTKFDHTTIAATILRRFCSPLPPRMSPRADTANDLRELFDLPAPRPRAELADMLARLTSLVPGGGGVVRDHRTNRAGTGRAVAPAEGLDDFHGALTFARMITGSAR